jgi:hypothetical protein
MTLKKSNRAAAKGGQTKPQKTPKALARPDDMPSDVLEFIQAIDDYKRSRKRPFPSWSEVLEVLKDLGYKRAG